MSENVSRLAQPLAVLGAMLALGLGGCVNQQKDVQVYRRVLDGDKPLPVHVEPGAVVTLTDALRLADQNEEQLAIQGETYLQSLIAKDKAFANFLPAVSISPSYTVQDTHGLPPGTPNHSANAAIGAGWNGFNAYSDIATFSAANQTIEQQHQLLLDAQQTVLIDVISAYYTVLNAEQSVDVLTNSLKVQQANVDFIKAQEAVGTAKPLDTAQAEAQASQTQVSLYQAIANVRNGRIMLAYLVDAPIENNPLKDNFDPPAEVASLENWEAQAESGRQDLLAANAAVRAARNNVDVAFGEYYPSLTLNFNYFVYKEFDPATSLWTGLISANLPLFTGGEIHADVRNAWSLFRQSALTQSQLRRNIDQTVATAYTNLDLAHKELAELSIQVTAARDALYTAQELYKNGGGTFLDVLTAQDTLLTTQLELTTEVLTQKTAYFNLLRSVGKLQMTVAESATQPSEALLRDLATQPVTAPTTLP